MTMACPTPASPSPRESAAYLAKDCPEVIRGLDLDRPALLEASAGTGKTYAIEHLVLRLLSERALDLENVLVLTFTRKAAGELKEKIRARLATRLADGADLPEALRSRLREAWLNFDKASVFTIHGFCERVLRNHAFENRALFAHERADDRAVFEQALLEEMRSTWLTDDSPGGAGYAGFQNLADRVNLTAKDDWSQDILKLAQAWNPFRGDVLRPVPDPEAEARCLAEADAALGDFLATVGEVAEIGTTQHPGYLAVQDGKYTPASRKKTCKEQVLLLLDLAHALRGDASPMQRFDRVVTFLADNSRSGMVTKGFAFLLPEDPSPALGAVAEALERFRTARTKVEAERRKASFQAQIKVVTAVRRGAGDYKRARGILGFDDMIENLCAALERPELVRTLRQRYAVCIVDEFQDTDPLQWRIFKTVFLESGGTHPLWLIGDPKQAIYAFRGGDIHTYMSARADLQALSREGKAGGLSLGANFRSSRALIEACNAVFDHPGWFHVKQATPGDDAWRLSPDPDPLGYLPVVPGGRPVQECREDGAGGLPAKPIILRDFSAIDGKAKAQRAVNRWIANEIKALLAAPERLLVPDGGAWRPLDWGDICVLTRNNSEIRALEAQFRKQGIPFQIHKRTGLWQSAAATEYLALLESLEDPRDSGKHARAMLTRFFRSEDVPTLSAPPAEVHPSFEAWTGFAERRQWQRLFHDLLYGTGILYRESLDGDGDRLVMDCQHVAQNLVQEALRENLSLGALVQRLRDLRREVPDAEDDRHLHREDSESRKVALMTYHISKGLEFPVVFLGGMGGSRKESVLRYREGGRTVFNYDLEDPAATATARQEADDEDKRLYYVALTRPRFKLYIPLPKPKYGSHACTLGGFVADAVRAAEGKRPDLFHRRLEGNFPEGVRAPEGTLGGTSVEGSTENPGVFQDVGLPPGFPGDFPRDPALSGPAADFNRRRRTLASYSQLVRGHVLEAEGADGRYDKDDAPTAPETEVEATDGAGKGPAPATSSALPGNALPGGREVGNMFHEILENIDFDRAGMSQGPQDMLEHGPTRELFASRLEEYRLEPAHMDEVARIIWHTLNAAIPDCGSPVAGEETFRFADLIHRRHEMEFLFPYPGGEGPGQGYLWGYIDLVFRREGRYYLLDWKSNRLDGYGRSALQADVLSSRYDLQYMLYSMALDRWLRSLIPDYDPARHFGGVYYVYLRGLDASAPQGGVLKGVAGPAFAPGVFALRPTPRQVAEDFPAHLDRALGRKAP